MKILPCGAAIIERDTHYGAWVAQQQRLDVAAEMLKPFRHYVPIGATVIDVGANIGSHTVTYAEWVGTDGRVFAFEPNPEAFACLLHNTQHLKQVIPVDIALADEEQYLLVNPDPANIGATWLSRVSGAFSVPAVTLDTYAAMYSIQNVSFVKVDAEGWETGILRGGRELINRNRPVMLIEVNAGALERAGSSREELFGELDSLGYVYAITDQRLKWDDLQYDILCVPR